VVVTSQKTKKSIKKSGSWNLFVLDLCWLGVPSTVAKAAEVPSGAKAA
jgi:hypothetical protein